MASSSTVAWMPSHGRHQINIGPSFGRAIKARKLKGSPASTTKRSNLPERDFYAFRYNFKPGAIDSTKPASIEVKKSPENTQIVAEFPSKEMNEVCTYNGSELPAKEVECIIVYDEETGQYTLEKLDSVVSLQFGGKRVTAPSAQSPATEPSTSSTPLANNTKGKSKQTDNDDDLQQSLLAGNDIPNPKRATTINHRQEEEEEEEEGEEIEIPLRLQVSKRPHPPPSPSNHTTKPTPNPKPVNTLPHSSSISTKPGTTTTTTSKPTQIPSPVLPAPKPKSAPKQPKKPKAPPPSQTPTNPASHTTETIEIERPAKKPRISTTTTTSRQSQAMEQPKPKPSVVQLSLPGGHSTFVAPPAPPGSIPPTKKPTTNTNNNTPAIPMTVPPGVSANITMEEVLGGDDQVVQALDEEEEDEDWEAVPTSAVQAAAASQHEYDRLEDEIFGQGFGEDEEEQEIDVNAFEAELNEQMEMEEEEEDDDMEDVMQEAASAVSTNRPISLNRLASGIAAGESEDDYSSSESESD